MIKCFFLYALAITGSHLASISDKINRDIKRNSESLSNFEEIKRTGRQVDIFRVGADQNDHDNEVYIKANISDPEEIQISSLDSETSTFKDSSSLESSNGHYYAPQSPTRFQNNDIFSFIQQQLSNKQPSSLPFNVFRKLGSASSSDSDQNNNVYSPSPAGTSSIFGDLIGSILRLSAGKTSSPFSLSSLLSLFTSSLNKSNSFASLIPGGSFDLGSLFASGASGVVWQGILRTKLALIRSAINVASGIQSGISASGEQLGRVLVSNAASIEDASFRIGNTLNKTARFLGSSGVTSLENSRVLAKALFRGTGYLLNGLGRSVGNANKLDHVHDLSRNFTRTLARKVETAGQQTGQLIGDITETGVNQIQTVLRLLTDLLSGGSNIFRPKNPLSLLQFRNKSVLNFLNLLSPSRGQVSSNYGPPNHASDASNAPNPLRLLPTKDLNSFSVAPLTFLTRSLGLTPRDVAQIYSKISSQQRNRNGSGSQTELS